MKLLVRVVRRLLRLRPPQPKPVVWQSLVGVHSPSACEGRGCPIHHPSQHHMRDWPQNWRNDRRMMERICEHGVGHPDPDDLNANRAHGCDGCCDPAGWEIRERALPR